MPHRRNLLCYINGTAGRLEQPELNIPLHQSPEDVLPIPRLRFSVAAAVVFAASVLCFCNNYDGHFVYDDKYAIIKNKDVLPETPLSEIFTNDFWGNKIESKHSHKSYRPLTVLTFKLSYYLGGGLSPPWFHIPNILLHGVVSILLLSVFSILFGGYTVVMETGKLQFKAAKSSTLACLLFAVHPIHTESVSGVVGRADLLCALFFLCSFLMYVKTCAQDLNSKDGTCKIYRPESFSLRYLLCSMVLCGMSMLCKEQGITVIGICSAYDIIIVCHIDLLELVGLRQKAGKNANRRSKSNGNRQELPAWLTAAAKRHIYLFITGVLLLQFRWRIMGSEQPVSGIYQSPHSYVNGTILRSINYNYLYSINAWILVFPWWLCYDWSMGCVPIIDSFADPRLLPIAGLWLVLFSLLWACLKKPIAHDQRQVARPKVLTMSLALTIVPFLPASNILFHVGFVIAERNLYLSSMGFCMIVVIGVRRICATNPHQSKVQVCLAVLIGMLTVRSVQRSAHWRSAYVLYTSAESVCPSSAVVLHNTGIQYADAGLNDVAEAKHRKAIALSPEYTDAMSHLGSLLVKKGEYLEAEEVLQKAVELRPMDGGYWFNLGVVKVGLQKRLEAANCFVSSLRYRPRPDVYEILGSLYLEMNMYAKALEALRNSINLDPKQQNVWTIMAMTFNDLGQNEKSIEVSLEGLKHVPDIPELYFNLGIAYGKLANYQEGEDSFLKAIHLDPEAPKYYANLGILYHLWGKYDQAESAYKEALNLNSEEPTAKENLEVLNSMKKKESLGNIMS